MERRELALVESRHQTKDEYIAELEAQLQNLRGDLTKASSFGAAFVHDNALHRHEDNDGGLVRVFSMST